MHPSHRFGPIGIQCFVVILEVISGVENSVFQSKKAGREKREFIETSSPSTSSEANSVIEKKRHGATKRDDEDYRKRRKRKKY